MAYILNKSNGQQFLVLGDGITNNLQSPLSFVGKNVSNYGDEQNQNFLYLLENFANGSVVGGQPRSPVTGQLWFDTSVSVNRMLAFDGSSWRPLAVSMYDTTTTNTSINALSNPRYPFSSSQPGDFFVNSVTKQMFVVTSTASDVSLIGPEGVPGYGTTRMLSTLMTDTVGAQRPVIQLTVDGEVICVLSKTAFSTTISEFPNVYKGLTFRDYNTSTRYNTNNNDYPAIYGLHDQLDTSYPRRTEEEHIQNNWYFDDDYSLRFGTFGNSSINWASAGNALTVVSSGSIKLSSSDSQIIFDSSNLRSTSLLDLGTIANPFKSLYVRDIAAVNTITSARIFEDGFRVLTSATLPSVGVVGVTGTSNQITANTNQGVVTLSLPNSMNVQTLTAVNFTSTNVSASSIFDNGSRVITTDTLPTIVSTITGTANQISVNVTGRTANLSIPDNVSMFNLTATIINSLNIFQEGRRVLTTATLPSVAVISVQGTANEITATTVNGNVTLRLPGTVNINTLTVTTSTVGSLTLNSGTAQQLTVNRSVIGALTATTVNVTGALTVNSLGATDIAVSNNATIYNDLTATNIYSAANLFGYTVKGAYGDFGTQLNATYGAINTLTVTTLKDQFGTGITKIDKDGTMAANSDLNLATQRAIVTYVQSVLSGISIPTPTPPVPTGSVFYVAMQSPPTGYLVCDGSSKSTTTYSALFSEIGYTYGGSGAAFNLPDLRGTFIRGWDNGRGLDPARVFGSSQDDSFESHDHFTVSDEVVTGGKVTSSGPVAYSNGNTPGEEEYELAPGTTDATLGRTSAVGGTETRPKNVALTPIIKT